jgi:hypothetical protein
MAPYSSLSFDILHTISLELYYFSYFQYEFPSAPSESSKTPSWSRTRRCSPNLRSTLKNFSLVNRCTREAVVPVLFRDLLWRFRRGKVDGCDEDPIDLINALIQNDNILKALRLVDFSANPFLSFDLYCTHVGYISFFPGTTHS